MSPDARRKAARRYARIVFLGKLGVLALALTAALLFYIASGRLTP